MITFFSSSIYSLLRYWEVFLEHCIGNNNKKINKIFENQIVNKYATTPHAVYRRWCMTGSGKTYSKFTTDQQYNNTTKVWQTVCSFNRWGLYFLCRIFFPHRWRFIFRLPPPPTVEDLLKNTKLSEIIFILVWWMGVCGTIISNRYDNKCFRLVIGYTRPLSNPYTAEWQWTRERSL